MESMYLVILGANQHLHLSIVIKINCVDTKDSITQVMLPENLSLIVEDIDVFIFRTSDNLVMLIIVNISNMQGDETIIERVAPFFLKFRGKCSQIFPIGRNQDFYLPIVIQVCSKESMNRVLHVHSI